jgi:hypothetical protein
LDPPAFEEGILENYPFFLDIVLNHISGDSLEFSHAVTCLRILFEMLGTHFPFPIPKVSFFSFNFIIHSFG